MARIVIGMMRYLLIFLFLLSAPGCGSVLLRNFDATSQEFLADVFVVSAVSSYHNREGKWPQNLSESLATSFPKQNQDTTNPDLKNVLLTPGENGKIILDIDINSLKHRKIEVQAPNSAEAQYTGKYLPVEGSAFQYPGTFRVMPN